MYFHLGNDVIDDGLGILVPTVTICQIDLNIGGTISRITQVEIGQSTGYYCH